MNHIWFFIANVGFELGMIFYNAYLPDQAMSLHFNFGWWNHNEKGKEQQTGRLKIEVDGYPRYGFTR